MKRFVLGFAYNEDSVLLIRKNRPKWQQGFLNGIGGHVEEGETSHYAMSREFNEETNGKFGWTDPKHWTYVCTFKGKGYEVDTFGCKKDFNGQLDHDSDEGHIHVYPLKLIYDGLFYDRMISNLKWLIPLATSGSRGNINQTIIIESIPETQGAEIV